MLTLPQGASGTAACEDAIVLDEPDDVVERLMSLISGLELQAMDSLVCAEKVLLAAEKYDMPGPTSVVRLAVNGHIFQDKPLLGYALATHMGWMEEAKRASKLSLQLWIHDPSHERVLTKVSSPYLVKLYNLHGQRKHYFRRFIDTAPVLRKYNSSALKCTSSSCYYAGESNLLWLSLKEAMCAEMERRPLGDTLFGKGTESSTRAKACWKLKCSRCPAIAYNKTEILTAIKDHLSSSNLNSTM